MKKLWVVNYQDGEHEEEMELFVHDDNPRPSTEDGRAYLLSVLGLIGSPHNLKINGVYKLDTAYDIAGEPYAVRIEE